MPLLRHGCLRKQWRYAGVFGEELALCAGVVRVGPLGQTFWAVWDRRERRMREGTRMAAPWGREVSFEGSLLRIQAGEVSAELRLGEGRPVEVTCPSGEGSWAWTRKQADVPIGGTVRIGAETRAVEAQGVIDESAGYHQRRIEWIWSAGVGRSTDGRSIGWNLVTGINDPPSGSERAIWVDGVPSEVEPVRFDGLDAIDFADGARLRFQNEAERARTDNLLLIRSWYRQPFGAFEGSLPGGIELASGYGVMEEHTALW